MLSLFMMFSLSFLRVCEICKGFTKLGYDFLFSFCAVLPVGKISFKQMYPTSVSTFVDVFVFWDGPCSWTWIDPEAAEPAKIDA